MKLVKEFAICTQYIRNTRVSTFVNIRSFLQLTCNCGLIADDEKGIIVLCELIAYRNYDRFGYSAWVAVVKYRPAIHYCEVLFFWSFGITYCMLFTL